ncbi:WD40-repeat-containing domain protein [Blyttiomyces helicus]|uniref:WD40-repeat-containing domain protein n=1 Tax=Blyttiomyces helicus TaxID=388810 RepID=A0A4P9WHI7_9FUNG|nr:WD40-repeat-containing domain protein [Blyttiomyces helicus]|eukprot:RKO91313.1 WD40-repeat-containing domain protein [Blyttiomyces helicus]
MISEVAILTSANDPQTISCWDIRSGAVLGTLKGNKSDQRTASPIHLPGALAPAMLAVAQNDRAVVHLWSWSKGQLHSKFVVPEKLSSLVVSNSGLYCVGGGLSGRIYVWELQTGTLLRKFDAHYKPVRALRFTPDDTAFLSSGEDSVTNVYLLASVFASLSDPNYPSHSDVCTPVASFSGHVLPITEMVVGAGAGFGSGVRMFTASLDRTVKIWDPTHPTPLATLLFPKPITSLAVDPSETRLYAGASDGSIFRADLYRRETETAGTGIVGLREGVVEDGDAGGAVFRGHSQSVLSLSLSFDGTLLVSASEDGTAIVWDTVSLQALRTFPQQKSPITDATVIIKPAELMDASVHHTLPVVKSFKTFQQQQRPGSAEDGQARFVEGRIVVSAVSGVSEVSGLGGLGWGGGEMSAIWLCSESLT